MKQKAFTLIELLIVVAIIGILAAIAVPNFQGALVKSRLSATALQMKAVAQVNQTYLMDWGTFLPYENTDNGQIESFWRFTTPVAYADNYNIFIDQFFLDDSEKEDETNYDKTFDYSYSSRERFTFRQKREKNIVADMMILESVAPDGIDSIFPTNNFAQKGLDYNTFMRYNSTNGLYSVGDITYTPFGVPRELEHRFIGE